MKRYLLLALILMCNIHFYGNKISKNVICKTKLVNGFTVHVNNTDVLKPVQKSNLPVFYFNGNIFKSTYPTFKNNSLFFADGDILNEDFETASGWTFTNDTIGNKWVIGSAVNNGGTKSLYISNDNGATYEYDNKSATIVHAYKDIDIPATAEEISVSFDWKCLGEGTDPKKHYFNAWLVPDTFVPVKGAKITELKNERILLGSFNNNSTTFKSEFLGADTDSLQGKKAKIVFEWINDTIDGWQPPAAIDNLKISTLECTKPSNITFEDIKADSVLVKWNASKVAIAEYDIYYSKDSTNPTAESIPSKSGIKTTSFLLDKLEASTYYYVWIRSVCGSNKGSWTKMNKFKSACGIVSIPFWEGFNTDSPSSECWTVVDGNEDNSIWQTDSFWKNRFEGDKVMVFYNSNSAIINDDWLISPTIKMNGTYRLKYHYKVSSYATNEFEVLLSKDGTEIKDFKQSLVAKKTYNNETYIEKIVILYNITGDINIAWHVTGKEYPVIYIDNIIIEEVETCAEPMDLDAKDIKIDQATIFWKDDFGGKSWEYIVQDEGKSVPAGTDSGTLVDKKEVVVKKDNNGDNLNSNTVYEYYVRTVCEDGKFSIWSGPFAFRTTCDVLSVPYREGFNTDSDYIYCWTIVDGNNDDTEWQTIPYAVFEGDQCMNFAKKSSDSTAVNDDWLISPTLKVNGTYRLKYYYNVYGSGEFEVLLSKDGAKTEDFKQILVAKKTYNNYKYLEKIVFLDNIVGDINIAWHANGIGNTNIVIDNVIIEEVEGCPEPLELDIKDVETNKVTILWTDEVGATTWEYFVQAEGKGEPTKKGTITNNKENFVLIENETGANLLSNTDYEFYVRTVCNSTENSLWSGPFKFRTLCSVYTIPFWEGFNTDSKTARCWNIVNGNNDNSVWKPIESWEKSLAFEGDRAMLFNKYSSDISFVNDDWLISPTIKMNGTYRLKYHYKVSNTYAGSLNEFEVLLSEDGNEVKDFKRTLVAKKAYNNNVYVEKIIILNNIKGDINIAWHANGGGSSYFLIDNVIIEEVENCAEPIELDVKDIMSNSATILWIDDSDSKKWEYFVQEKGKGKPIKKGAVTSVKENIITTENETGGALLPNTKYEFYARTICDDGTNSIWSGPFEFLTDCIAFDLPFWEGFNKNSESIRCWNIVDENKGAWKTFTSGAFEGNQAVSFNGNKSSIENYEWLITPTLKANGGMYRIKYHYKTFTKFDNEFEILMSTKGIDIKDFTTTILPKHINKNGVFKEKVIFVDNLSGNVNFAWHITNPGSFVFLDNVFIEKVETCPEPIELGVKDIMSDTVTILWTDDFKAKSWEYFVQISGKGEPVKSGTITSAKENIITIENETNSALLHNTEYEYYVRTVCDDGTNSIWSGPFSFKTLCGVFDLPFWEGFNTDSESYRCWKVVNANKDREAWKILKNDLYYYGPIVVSFEGDRAMYLKKYSPDATFLNDDWLISPTIKANGGMYRIKYHYKTHAGTNNEFEILMSTEGTEVEDFTKLILPKTVYKNKNYKEKVIFVDNLSGDINFAWHITTKGTSEIYLDNVFVEKVETCPEPYYVEITGQTDSSVDIEWEQYGSGDKWEVIAVPLEEEIPDEKHLKPIVVTTNPKVTITGLNSGKVYTFYVRVICQDGTTSDWSTGKDGSTIVKANNDCSGSYNIPTNKDVDCDLFASGTLLGATLSKTAKERCTKGRDPISDVWFEFTATAKEHLVNIYDIVSPSDGKYNFSVALYEDDCSATDSPIACFYGSHGVFKDFEVGKKYYLRIYSEKESDIFFKICINATNSIYVSPSGEDYTVDELVKDVLVNSNCDLVSNIKYQAGDNSTINTFGYFNKGKSNFPYEKGIVLSTHAVNSAAGPFLGRLGGSRGKLPEWDGDSDLNDVINKVGGSGFGRKKYVSVLEFDFIPVKDSIKFEYIFASVSYMRECDVSCLPGAALFAAWLTEEETGMGKNLALVPGTTDPIAISTIRDYKKTGAECESIEPQFFGECYSYPHSGSDPLTAPINYSGVTVPMTSEKVAVKPGKNYHIKIAIADFCHNSYHVSAVFFNGSSFDIGSLDLGKDLLVATNTALCEEEEKTIYSRIDTEQATIKWFKDGVEIPGESDSQLTVTELGDYEVIGKYESINCEVKGSIRVEVYPNKVSEPEDIVFCVNSVSSKEFMDITTNEQIILKDLKFEDYEIFYYLTKEDSRNDEKRIENPTKFEIPKDKKVQEIFVRIFYKVTGCSNYNSFSLVPEKITAPESIVDQQSCSRYIFKELPEHHHYFTEKGAKGREYRAGDILDKPGIHTMYICYIDSDCYEEVSFNLEILAAVKAKEFRDEIMDCDNYVLQDLPKGNRYFTEPDAQGVELFPGDVIRFTQTIYVYAKSDIGPNYCIDQSSFEIRFEECPIPKGISPNGDGVNDVLDLEVHGVTSIVIYNRYGMEVYSHSEGYTNQWHGQSNSGNELPDGTYYYVIEARGKTRTGWIQVNR